MAPQVQIQRVAETIWSVTLVVERRAHVFKYDVLARIVQEGDEFFVERSYWVKDEQKWERRQRGYQLFKGAERWASDYALGNTEVL